MSTPSSSFSLVLLLIFEQTAEQSGAQSHEGTDTQYGGRCLYLRGTRERTDIVGFSIKVWLILKMELLS